MNITKQMHAAIWTTLGVILIVLGLLSIPFGIGMLNIVALVVVAVGVGWGLYFLYVLWRNAVEAQRRVSSHRMDGSRF